MNTNENAAVTALRRQVRFSAW